MPARRRSTVSPTVLNDLWQRVYAPDRQPAPRAITSLTTACVTLGACVAVCWFVVVLAAPILLILAIFGIANYTGEWVTVAGTLMRVTLATAVLMTATFLTVAHVTRYQPLTSMRLLAVLSSLVSLVLLAWVVWAKRSSPPTPTEQAMLLGTSVWFATVLIAVSGYVYRTALTISRPLRTIHLALGILCGGFLVMTTLTGSMTMFQAVEWDGWRKMMRVAQTFTFVAYQAVSISMRSPRTSGFNWKRLLTVTTVGVLSLIGIFALFNTISAR